MVDKCIAHLSAAANGLSRNEDSQDTMDVENVINVVEASLPLENQASNALKFRRCLEVLEAYMNLFDAKYSHSLMSLNIARKHNILDETRMITVKVRSYLNVNFNN